MSVGETFRGIGIETIRGIDAVVTVFHSASGFVPELDRQNRDGVTFSIETHGRGGEYGLLIYPDGTVVKTETSNILYRIDTNTNRIMDRVKAGKPPKGYLFIPQDDFSKYEDELKEVFRGISLLPLPNPLDGPGGQGGPVQGSYCGTILSKRPHEQLLAKFANNI